MQASCRSVWSGTVPAERNGDVLHSRYIVSQAHCLLFSLVHCLVFCFEYPEDPFSIGWKIMSSASSSSSSCPIAVGLVCDVVMIGVRRFESAAHKIAFHGVQQAILRRSEPSRVVGEIVLLPSFDQSSLLPIPYLLGVYRWAPP